jgi:AcrR family transcriptional regulator
MVKRDVREQMIRGAAELLSTHGVQGTSFADVLAHTGAPRGSIYHHFPDGKEELVHAAASSVGEDVLALLDAMEAATPAGVVDAFVDGWRAVLVGGEYRRGCAIAATCLGSSDAPSLHELSGEVFASWTAALSRAFVRSGAARRRADDLAALCLAAVEGALVLGRAAHDDRIFDVLKRQLRRLAAS